MLTADSSRKVAEFALRRPPFWSTRFTATFMLLVLAAVGYYAALSPAAARQGGLDETRVLELLVPVGACLFALLMRWGWRPRLVPPVQFYDDHLSAPRYPEARRARSVPYADILSVDLRGKGSLEQLFIGSRSCIFTFPRGAFILPDGIERVLKELYLRILRLPQGTAVVEQIARRRKLALTAMSRPPTVTHLLLAVEVIVFGIEWLTGTLQAPFGAVRFGAAAPVWVRAGEVYRLLASVLLHANALHLGLDGLALFFLGAVLERILGRARFLVIYLLSGLGGAIAAVAVAERLDPVNASAATFGLIGALVVVSLRLGNDLPPGFRQPWRWWVLLAALNAALTLFVYEIDPVSLAAGLVVGVAAAWLVVEPEVRDLAGPQRTALRLLAGLLATLYVAASVTAIARGLRANGDEQARLARAALENGATSNSALEVLVWRLVRYRAASYGELETGLGAAEQLVARRPADASALDAEGALRYRLGKLEAAIAAAREALELEPRDPYAEHLALYLGRRLSEAGVLVLGPPAAETARLELRPPQSPDGQAVAQLSLGEALRRGASVWALAKRGNDTVGLLRLRLPAGSSGTTEVQGRGGEAWPPGARYVVALVDGECSSCVGEPSLTFWHLEAEARDLP